MNYDSEKSIKESEILNRYHGKLIERNVFPNIADPRYRFYLDGNTLHGFFDLPNNGPFTTENNTHPIIFDSLKEFESEEITPPDISTYFHKIIHLFKGKEITDKISILDFYCYGVNVANQYIYFMDHKGFYYPFSYQYFNQELHSYKLKKITKTEFNELQALLFTAKSKMKRILQTATCLIDPFEPLRKTIISWLEEINQKLSINLYNTEYERAVAQILINNYTSVLRCCESAFTRQILSPTENAYKYLQNNLRKLFLWKKEENEYKKTIDYFIVILMILYNKSICIPNNSLPKIEALQFGDGTKKAGKILCNNTQRNWDAMSSIIARILTKNPAVPLNQVIICPQKSVEPLVKFFCIYFNVLRKDNYTFKGIPISPSNASFFKEKSLLLFTNPRVEKFQYEKPYRFFHGNIIQKRDISFKNNLPSVIITDSAKYAKRIEDYYNASVITVGHFRYEPQMRLFTNAVFKLMVLYGSAQIERNNIPKSVIKEFLNKYTKKEESASVLSSLLIDCLKIYLEKNYGKIQIKDYATQICDYIGNPNALVRRVYSEEEISKLPKKYQEQLTKANRPISRRFLGLSFSYDEFQNSIKDINESIDWKKIGETVEKEYTKMTRPFVPAYED